MRSPSKGYQIARIFLNESRKNMPQVQGLLKGERKVKPSVCIAILIVSEENWMI